MTPIAASGIHQKSQPDQAAECVYCSLPVPGVRAGDIEADEAYCCLGCKLAHRITNERGSEGESTWQLTLIGVAIFLSMNVMVFNWMLYGQEVFNPEGHAESSVASASVTIFRYISMLFCAVVLVILGWPIASSGLASLRRRQINTDVLLALGVLAAFGYSYISVLRESGSVYFDSVCMILLLVTIGRSMEARARLSAGDALRSLDKLIPEQAIVVRGEAQVELPTSELKPGDVTVVRPGMRCAADGTIVEGESSLDEHMITGESEPVRRGLGDAVYAGSLNGDGTLQVRVEAVGEGSHFQHIVDALKAARRGRGRHQRIADRVASIFVPVVVALAIGTCVWTSMHLGWQSGVMRSLSVLLIACPCALGVATPMAIWVAMGRAANRGIIIRKVEAFENLAHVQTVLFDKTGTLTTGRARVDRLVTASEDETYRREVLGIARGLAQASTHHLADAIVRFATERDVAANPVRNAQNSPGEGVAAESMDGQVAYRMGSLRFIESGGCALNAEMADSVRAFRDSGVSLTCVGWGGAVRAVFSFQEDLRDKARPALKRLGESGKALGVLTGDHRGHGARLHSALGIDVHAELLPADKTRHVEALHENGRSVAMVGDGINDAPALAAATVGIAMGCGADVSRESADACLMSNDLTAIPWLFDLSKATVKVIKQNLFWAFAYNVVGLGLAATGRLGPVTAAIAMLVSSFLVVANSMRLNRMPLGIVGETTASVG